MKKVQTLVVIIAAVLFFTACEKDEVADKNFITGTLLAGENMSSTDFAVIGVLLAKVTNGTPLSDVNTETEDIEIIKETSLNPDGSFIFEDLENGNYLIVLYDGFTFANKDFVTVAVDGYSENNINELVNRLTVENGSKNYKWRIKRNSYFTVSEILFYYDGVLHETITPAQISDNEFTVSLDRNKNVTLVVKCLNENGLITSPHAEVFGFLADKYVSITTEHGTLYLSNSWKFGGWREITLSPYFGTGMMPD